MAKNDPISRIEIIFDTPVFQYENLILECRYRLNVDKKLYSIKWYVCFKKINKNLIFQVTNIEYWEPKK